jgi:hypothetical protein
LYSREVEDRQVVKDYMVCVCDKRVRTHLSFSFRDFDCIRNYYSKDYYRRYWVSVLIVVYCCFVILLLYPRGGG